MRARHPDYERWVKTFGQTAADDENRAWLQSSDGEEAEREARIVEREQWHIQWQSGPRETP